MASPNGLSVIIFMNILVNRRFQQLIEKVLREVYKPELIQFLPSLYMPLYITGGFSGIVLDCGFTQTEVIAVVLW